MLKTKEKDLRIYFKLNNFKLNSHNSQMSKNIYRIYIQLLCDILNLTNFKP